MTPWLTLADATVALGGRDVLTAVTGAIAPGELVVVVGPNGAGKSTLLRALAGLVPTRAGAVRVFDRDPARGPRDAIARDLAFLPQGYELAFPYLVEEVVLLGRYVHQRGLGLARDADREAARAAMIACDVDGLAARRFDELSGGEARRVIVAQALCQGARALLLDEPTTGLDPIHARRLFAMVRAQCDEGARAAVIVTHDLDLALRYGRTLWLIAGGRLVARGAPADVLAGDAAARAFELTIHVGELPDGSRFAVPYAPPDPR